MVLESILHLKDAELTPRKLFFLGIVYASIALFLSMWIFPTKSSIVMVFLIVLASLPLVYKILKYEALQDLKVKNYLGKYFSMVFLHLEALKAFMYLFCGFAIALSLWFIFLPPTFVTTAFQSQIATLNGVNISTGSGQFFNITWFFMVFLNNIKVLFFCLVFSFFFGSGALFILSWNASVIAAAIGNFFRERIGMYAGSIGLIKIAGYFHIFSWSLLRYGIHGLFEILAYFIGGLAGGLISIAVLNYKFGDEGFNRIMVDVGNLLFLALIVLLIAGLIEAFISPILYL